MASVGTFVSYITVLRQPVSGMPVCPRTSQGGFHQFTNLVSGKLCWKTLAIERQPLFPPYECEFLITMPTTSTNAHKLTAVTSILAICINMCTILASICASFDFFGVVFLFCCGFTSGDFRCGCGAVSFCLSQVLTVKYPSEVDWNKKACGSGGMS